MGCTVWTRLAVISGVQTFYTEKVQRLRFNDIFSNSGQEVD